MHCHTNKRIDLNMYLRRSNKESVRYKEKTFDKCVYGVYALVVYHHQI